MGSIDQLEQLEVNGSRQWVHCRSEDQTKPVVLFVHGGPGSPLMLFSRAFDQHFIRDFVVVHWDQRGSGKSYNPKESIATFSIEQVAQDGLAVVNYLKQKFQKDRVLLVGHSWGSMVGSEMVNKRPEDFQAYISVGTVADMKKGDLLKFAFLGQQIAVSGNATHGKELTQMGPPPWVHFSQLVYLSRLMTIYKGSFYSLSPDEIERAIEKTAEYTAKEIESLNKAMEQIWHKIFPFLCNYRAIDHFRELKVKTYFAQGDFDMATPTSLARDYFSQLLCPAGKEWVSFAKSSHFPMYEEPKSFLDLLRRASAIES
ncbi:MAG: alpha/beta fold hydrolase [Bdellovibrionales bacterium]